MACATPNSPLANNKMRKSSSLFSLTKSPGKNTETKIVSVMQISKTISKWRCKRESNVKNLTEYVNQFKDAAHLDFPDDETINNFAAGFL